MILKNVRLTDSGLYTAVLSGDKDKIYAEYDVTVTVSGDVPDVGVCLVTSTVGLVLMVSAVVSVHYISIF